MEHNVRFFPRPRSLALVSLVLGPAFLCSAATIIYEVNQTIGAGGVTGDIVTDGMIGNLATSDVVGYNLLINDGTDPPFDLTSVPPLDIFVTGSDLSATATQLLFNFSGADDGVFGILQPSADYGVCFVAGAQGGCFNILTPGPGEALDYEYGSIFNDQFTSASGTQVIGAAVDTPESSNVALLSAGIIALLAFRKLVNRRRALNRGKFQFVGFQGKDLLDKSGVMTGAA
jgi:hypothetical protein